MAKVKSLFAFFILSEGKEQIMVGVDDNGHVIPLVYLTDEALNYEKMIPYVKDYAQKNNVFVELREYQLIEDSVEKFYPDSTQYNA